SQEEGVVIDAGEPAREAERCVHADAEHEQVAERIDQIPEDEQRIGGADLRLTHQNRLERARRRHFVASTLCVSCTNTSSRLAPEISTCWMCALRPSAATSSRTRDSSARSCSRTVLCITETRSAA